MKKSIQITLILAFSGLILTSCKAQSTPESSLSDFGTIQVGYMPILPFAPYWVAEEKGYFDEQGLDVEFQSFKSGSFMIPLLATGDLDAGGGQVGPELLNAVSQDLDVRIVCSQGQEPPGYADSPFLVRKDLFDSGEITSPADLKGKRVAINVPRGLAEFMVVGVLEQGGLTLDDVEITTMPFPDMNAAFANNAIDAAFLPHPLAGQAIGEGYAVILVDGDEIYDSPQTGVLYFGKRLLAPENKEIGVRFLAAYLKAVRDLQGEGWFADEHVNIVSEYTHIPVPAIKSGVVMYFGVNGQINQSSVEDMIEYYVSQGYTELSEPIPFLELYESTFLDEALERIGWAEE